MFGYKTLFLDRQSARTRVRSMCLVGTLKPTAEQQLPFNIYFVPGRWAEQNAYNVNRSDR